jgi:glycogen debranching enzyme
VTPESNDSSLRPNQLFAISLPFAVLDEKKWKEILRILEEELLTPYGFRTLSPRDPRYIPHYEGDPDRRDSSYHQGTIWPWLLGPFVAAYLKAFGASKEVKMKMKRRLDLLLEHVEDYGLGSISEIFDADPPHTPRGCVSQAWNVAELLRAYELLKSDEAKFFQPREFSLR